MALKGFDGFDHYSGHDDFLARSGFIQYQQPATNPSGVSFVTGRDGVGKALQLSVNFTFTYAVFADRNQTAGVGFAYQGVNSSSIGGEFMFEDTIANMVQVVVFFNPSNYAVEIYRGNNGDNWGGPADGVLLYASPNNVWKGQVYNFIEIWVTIDGAAGSVEVHVNGEQVAVVTGVSTQQLGSNAWFDRFGWHGKALSGSATVNIDDFHYADNVAGPGTFPCDTFLGDCACRTLFPVGNAAVQWTPLANANWQEVSEVAMDSDLSYNSSSTAAQEDLFNMQALTANVVAIYGLQVTGAYRKDDAATRVIKQGTRPAATVYYGSNWSLPDTLYGYFTDLWVLNPETGANWTRSDVNSSAFGYNLVS